MKILAFSDLHRDKKKAEEIVAQADQADVLIGAGDFGTAGTGTAETLEILQQARKPTLIVPGNHDDSEALQSFCVDWPNGYYIHGTGPNWVPCWPDSPAVKVAETSLLALLASP